MRSLLAPSLLLAALLSTEAHAADADLTSSFVDEILDNLDEQTLIDRVQDIEPLTVSDGSISGELLLFRVIDEVAYLFTIEVETVSLDEATKSQLLAAGDTLYEGLTGVEQAMMDDVRERETLPGAGTSWTLRYQEDGEIYLLDARIAETSKMSAMGWEEALESTSYGVQVGVKLGKGLAKIVTSVATGNIVGVIDGIGETGAGVMGVVHLSKGETSGSVPSERDFWVATAGGAISATQKFFEKPEGYWDNNDDQDCDDCYMDDDPDEDDGETLYMDDDPDEDDGETFYMDDEEDSTDSGCDDKSGDCGDSEADEDADSDTSGKTVLDDPESDAAALERFAVFAAIMGLDVYNSDKMADVACEGGLCDKDAIDVAFVDLSVSEAYCPSEDLCLNNVDEDGPLAGTLYVMEAECETGLCGGQIWGADFSEAALEDMQAIDPDKLNITEHTLSSF